MNKFSLLCAVSMFGLIALMMNCNNSTNPTPPKTLQLLQPTGGENFKVGQSVTVRWKINDLTQISSVEIDMSIDSGKSYPFTIANGTIPSSITDTVWIPTADQVSNKCILKIKSYTPPYVPDQSGIFTVSN